MTSNKTTSNGTVGRALRKTLALVLAGGRGSRLHDLTSYRSKPAVPFAGSYRIIDFTLSNCINSGLRKVCVLTQYRSHSLLQHIDSGWSMLRREFGEFIEVLPAQERVADSSWYQGTADAVYQNLDIIREHSPKYVLILAGDHIYKMDYSTMIAALLDQEADATIGSVEIPIEQARQFGIMQVDSNGRIIGFQEKPFAPATLPGRPGFALGSMGIYLFRADFLFDTLIEDAQDPSSGHDFGANILPRLYTDHRLIAYPFTDLGTGSGSYWRDVGTIDAYWTANLEIAGVTPPLNLYDEDWPIRTAVRQLPPAKFVFDDDDRRGVAIDSLISAGCIVSGATVRRCVVSNNVRIECGAELTASVVLPDVRIGERCRIRNAVIDSGCNIPADTSIGYDLNDDTRRFHVSKGGVVLVTPPMLGQVSSHSA
jgi:glucose-1-phosphate adenylyltransferase